MRINEVENIIGQPDIIAPNRAPQASFVYKYRKPEGYEGIFELAVDFSLIVVDISNTISKIE